MPSTNLPASIANGFLIAALPLLAVQPSHCYSQQPANAPTAATVLAENAEYFRRLDVNDDQSLSLEEFPFTTTHRPPNEIHVQFADGKTLKIAIPDYRQIYSPEISPDGERLMFPRHPAGAARSQIHEIDPDGDKPSVRYAKQPKDRSNICVCWSRDGKTFVHLSMK